MKQFLLQIQSPEFKIIMVNIKFLPTLGMFEVKKGVRDHLVWFGNLLCYHINLFYFHLKTLSPFIIKNSKDINDLWLARIFR